MISRVVGWAATASGFVFVGSLAWFLAGTQGFGLLARQGELCVRFISVPFARGRAQVDLALQRATRSAAGADEKAWFVSIGLGIRP